MLLVVSPSRSLIMRLLQTLGAGFFLHYRVRSIGACYAAVHSIHSTTISVWLGPWRRKTTTKTLAGDRQGDRGGARENGRELVVRGRANAQSWRRQLRGCWEWFGWTTTGEVACVNVADCAIELSVLPQASLSCVAPVMEKSCPNSESKGNFGTNIILIPVCEIERYIRKKI